MSDLKVHGVNLSTELVAWADRNYARLGYNSRSELLNDRLRQYREAIETDEAEEAPV